MQVVPDELDGAATILLCAPSEDGGDRELCDRLLCDGAAAGRTVLWVSFGRSPAECLAGFPDQEADRAVLAVGTPPSGAAITDESVTVDAVSTRSDLTALGIKLSRFLSSSAGAITICFDSLTALLDHVDLVPAYEFLHTVTQQCYAEGATIHFHLDPSLYDDQTVAAIMSLCDAHVAFGETRAVDTRADLD